MNRLLLLAILLAGLFRQSTAQTARPAAPEQTRSRWSLTTGQAIRWDVANDPQLPHDDHVEMSGRQVSAIVHYGTDANRKLILNREIYWPMFRTIPGPGEPEWAKYRAYLQRSYGPDVTPMITLEGKKWAPGPLETVLLDGTLVISHQPQKGLLVSRTLFPSTTQSAFIERWTVKNVSPRPVLLSVAPLRKEESLMGVYGRYRIRVTVEPVDETKLAMGQSLTFALVCRAFIEKDSVLPVLGADEETARRTLLQTVGGSLVLDTPDSLLNRTFAFAKIRASESLFATKMGLIHSPGGGRYYGGIWANDQVEYAGPFFPFLGYTPANEASLNAYRIFARTMKPDYARIWASFEMEGDYPCCSKDRGDAAMYAYGASRYSLALGDPAVATELWPAINWALEYCRRHTTPDGVVASQTDEMEGRLPTGAANLSTSSLTYGALRSAADLARSLGKKDTAALYDRRADTLHRAIDSYFGADIQGFRTYRYYKEHQTLRHWICLPLTMGVLERKQGTLQALLTRLWTPDGLAVEAGNKQFWDRGTLYALRGLFNAGETQTGLRYLQAYSRQRLLGEHVPYPVEASPEGGQAHLSAESALYCRVITEGLFGIQPTGLRSFTCLPRLPGTWHQMRLSALKAFGATSDILVTRVGDSVQLTVLQGKEIVFKQTQPVDQPFLVNW